MSRSCTAYVLALASAAIFAGGCAKQEMIKKDETIPAASLAKPAESAKTTPSAPETGLAKQPVTDTTLKETAAQESKTEAQTAAGMDTVYFDLDSYTLSPTARDMLVKNAAVMKKKGGVKVRIEGHCDERGSDEYNLALGEKRARAALDYLVTMGVPASRLSVISYGKEKPADPGHDEAAWARNRRDDFVIVSR